MVQNEEKQSKKKEHILVGLSSAPSNSKIVETASKMARAFDATLTALYIKTSQSEVLSEENAKRLQNNIKFAERMGATIVTVYSDDVALQMAEYAKTSGATKIVIGRTATKRAGIIPKPTLADKLIALATNIDIHIIPDADSDLREQKETLFKKTNALSIVKDLAISLGIIIVASLIGLFFAHLGFSEANIITLYILGVLITSIVTSSKLAWGFSSVASVLIFNFLFTKPRFSLMAYGDGYPITFAIMFVASLITGSLASKMHNQTKQSSQAAYRTKILFDANRLLQRASDDEEVLKITAEQLKKLLNREIVIFKQNKDALQTLVYALDDSFQIGEKELNIATSILINHSYDYKDAQLRCDYYPLKTQLRTYGIVAVYKNEKEIDSFENNIVLSLVGECALALENLFNAKEKELAAVLAENEQLRANLLRAISHDLRTPLTAISGNASNLISNASSFDEQTKLSIYNDIYNDSMWLINLVENLLSITRLEEGRMNLNFTAELIDEVVAEAVKHVHMRQGGQKITVVHKDEFLLAKMDTRLIIQIIINILDNAIKYTPKDSMITITTEKQKDKAIISIADNGAGIPDELKERVFDMFYTGANKMADSRRSIGLGLALCKSIISVHGGEIFVKDNVPSGAIFTFTLPIGEIKINE
ncbi:MAG: sensor histidine kinase KdpD [Clostridia bacterium]|nr:sensor histidine kinase KdpD [Clostridia bacterium]